MHRQQVKYFFALILSSIAIVNCEIFSAIDELEKLAVIEKSITEELKVFADVVRSDYMNRKLLSWQDEQRRMEQNVTQYITNPLNAFLMIKRSTADIDLIAKRFPEESKEFLKRIEKFQPSAADLSGAVEGLLRLQTVYRLKSEDFANGIIDGKKTRSPLTPHDLFVIGDEAFKSTIQDYFAQEYFNLAREKIKNGFDVDNEIGEINLLRSLISSYNRTGDSSNALNVVEELIKKYPSSKDFFDLKKSLLDNRTDDSQLTADNPFSDEFLKDGTYSVRKEDIFYSQVCRGNVTKDQLDQAQLRCRFVSTNPFSQLARFKIEEANLDPYIVMFIDVLSDAEIDFVKAISKQQLKRAMTNTKNSGKITSNIRVAQLSWLSDEKHEILERIYRRIEDMTGLSQDFAENLQVQNYGIGGHYRPHFDHKISGLAGDRIATMLFYLSDVEKGGGTAFTYLKVLISPRKGAAAFWFNLQASGVGDYRTRHAGCPVLLGSKWVANRWIREHGNEFRRPCTTENSNIGTERDIFIKSW